MSKELAENLRARIEAEGPIPLRAFMETALYDPEHGYYARGSFTTGRSGDFATAPDVGELMGATLARPVEAFAEHPGRLVEVGPGSGRLLVDVLDHLPPAARERLDVVLVERFETHRERLREALTKVGVEPRVVPDVSDLEPERTLLLANELLDALPAEVVQRGEDGAERMVVDVDGGFAPAWQPAPSDVVELAEDALERLPRGHRYEIAPGLGELLDGVDGALAPGVALFFDYGSRFEAIWPERPDGTLRGFREHRQVDPLTAPGETDITYDVDFSRVIDRAEDRGLKRQAFGPQERMLVHLGLMEQARETGSFLQAKQLLVPGAFAGRFMALALGRGGVAEDTRLKVDLDDPGLWDRGLAEPLGDLEGDLGASLEEQMEQAGDPFER